MSNKNIFKKSLELQLKAKDIGLDWLEIEGVIAKLREETDEVEEAIENNDKEAINEELGDLFFTFICLTRHLGCDPEEVLELANIKFKKRFDEVKALLKKEEMTYANPEEMDRLWRIIKKGK